MVLHKVLDQYVSLYQRLFKSVIRLGNNEVLKTLTKTLTFFLNKFVTSTSVTFMNADGADKNF